MKKGFTILEILATVTIIAIISSLAFVSINGIMKSKKKELYNIELNNIEDAASIYVIDNFEAVDNDIATNGEYVLKYSTLVDNNYIDSVINPLTSSEFEDFNICVTMHMNNYKYELMCN